MATRSFFSFPPMSYSYEHTAGLMFPISIGAQIYFAEGADTLAHNLVEVRPTIMTAVPRLYETLHQRIGRQIERERGLKRRLFESAVAIGRRKLDGGALSLGQRLVDPLLDRLVRTKVRARFGGRLKAMISGGAPLNPEIGSFFLALGVTLLQGYGQTEAAPVVCCNPPSRIRIKSVGLPVDGVRLRIADDGEILVSGDNVMKGYWNDPEATARTLDGGWLHTGDIGHVDADGYLHITDRKRDFIKNSGGDMISPARVEGELTLAPEIAQAMVIGDRRPYLVAGDRARPRIHRRFRPPTTRPGADLHTLLRRPLLEEGGSAMSSRASTAPLPGVERVRRFLIAGEPFSTANVQMTPTLKVRRHAIREVHGVALEALYEGKDGGLSNKRWASPCSADHSATSVPPEIVNAEQLGPIGPGIDGAEAGAGGERGGIRGPRICTSSRYGSARRVAKVKRRPAMCAVCSVRLLT